MTKQPAKPQTEKPSEIKLPNYFKQRSPFSATWTGARLPEDRA